MKTKESIKFSVVIPTYNMAKTLGETIRSVLGQPYKNYEIIVQDNASIDETPKLIKSFFDRRIKYFRNKKNLGYAKNIIEGVKNSRGDIIYFLGADDILSTTALSDTSKAFALNDNIGAVTRPYYWFQESIDTPIRITPTLNDDKDEVVSIKNFQKAVMVLHNEILGQLTGLAFRRKYLKLSFFTETNDWIAHGYPFINVFKEHPVVFLHNIPVAIRIGVNTIRKKGSDAYKVSPTKRWIEMLDELFSGRKFQNIKNYFIKNIIARNYLGLIQIKCYSKQQHLIREIYYLVRYNWTNIFSLSFWFFSLGCLLVPQSILPTLVDFYKNRINSKILKEIKFEYSFA